MAEFFSRLAERALGLAPVAQPDLPSMFAPLAPMELSTEISARPESARADRSTSDNVAPVATSRNARPQAEPASPIERTRQDGKFHRPLVKVREAISDSAQDQFPFAAEDVDVKSERGRSVEHAADRDAVRLTTQDSPPQTVNGARLIASIPDFKSFTTGRAETAAPTIQVSIGRVEVRAVTPPTQAPRIVERKAPPLRSLDQYLRERNEGRR